MEAAAGPARMLATERLDFRLWTADDVELAMALWGDPDVARLVGGPFSREQVRQRLSREISCQESDGVQYWPIFLRTTGEHVGCCGLAPFTPDERIYEIGFYLRKEHWGRGYGEEAARAVIGFAFGTLAARGLLAGHHPENEASRRLLAKLGFRYTHHQHYPPTGRLHPSYLLTVGALSKDGD